MTALAVVAGLDYGKFPYPEVAFDPVFQLERVFVSAEKHHSPVPKVFFLGDSLSMGPEGIQNAPGFVGWQLKRELRRRLVGNDQVDLWQFVTSGISLYTYYFLAARMIEAKPRQIVVQLNLFWFFDDWHSQVDRTAFAAWLPFSWWPEAAGLSLHKTGLKADQAIMARLLSGTWAERASHSLQRQQVRAQRWRDAVELNVQGERLANGQIPYRFVARGQFMSSQKIKERATLEAALERYGPALQGVESDHSLLLLLDAFVSRFADAGIDVVAYVPPHNMRHLAKLGISDFSGIEASIDQLAWILERHGGKLVDLHDLLPDAGFRDHLDHYVNSTYVPSPRMIARRLTAELLPRLRNKPQAQD